MINKSITENNKKRPIVGRLICRNNQKQIPLASESKNEMEKGTILIVDDNKGVLASRIRFSQYNPSLPLLIPAEKFISRIITSIGEVFMIDMI